LQYFLFFYLICLRYFLHDFVLCCVFVFVLLLPWQNKVYNKLMIASEAGRLDGNQAHVLCVIMTVSVCIHRLLLDGISFINVTLSRFTVSVVCLCCQLALTLHISSIYVTNDLLSTLLWRGNDGMVLQQQQQLLLLLLLVAL